MQTQKTQKRKNKNRRISTKLQKIPTLHLPPSPTTPHFHLVPRHFSGLPPLPINSIQSMSCHYSCSTCSTPTYMTSCTSCPTTRQLLASTCPCAPGYLEAQQPLCYPSSQLSYANSILMPIATVLFYANIALFWAQVLLILCRIHSQKMRIAIIFGQTIALVLNYPFLLDEVTQRYLGALSALNFSYTHIQWACTPPSSTCQVLQALWQPLLILPGILICFLISFGLMNACYRDSLKQPIRFRGYCALHWQQVLFLFVDLTAVGWSYRLTNAVLVSRWALIAVGLYLLLVAFVGISFFRIVNSEEQSKVVYRIRKNWVYGYDENYHLHFIDFLYSEGRRMVPNNPQIPSESRSHNPATAPQKAKQIVERFVPHSNLYLLQLLYKLTLGSTTALLPPHNPLFLLLPLLCLLLVGMCWLHTFCYYDKCTLFFYLAAGLTAMGCSAGYWVGNFWVAAVAVTGIATVVMVAAVTSLTCRYHRIGTKEINRIFFDDAEEQFINAEKIDKNENVQGNQSNHSQQVEDIYLDSNHQEGSIDHFIPQPINNIAPNRIPTSHSKQPPKPPKQPSPQPISSPSPSKPPHPKKKQICIPASSGHQSPQHNGIIRHSAFQQKLSSARQRITSRNRQPHRTEPNEPHDRESNQHSNPQIKQKSKSSQLQNKSRLYAQLSESPSHPSKPDSKAKSKTLEASIKELLSPNPLRKDQSERAASSLSQQQPHPPTVGDGPFPSLREQARRMPRGSPGGPLSSPQ